MKFVEAQRIRNLPPYLFARIEKLIAAKKEAGVDVISLGIGDLTGRRRFILLRRW